MAKKIVEKLLSMGRREQVIAAAKLGSRIARQTLMLRRTKKNLSMSKVSGILQEAGYSEEVADVMVAMSALRTLIPQYFESFDHLTQTDFHTATLSVVTSLENWLQAPSPATADQVLSQSVYFHNSYCEWLDKCDELEASEEDENDAREPSQSKPETELHETLREVCRLTSSRERDRGVKRTGAIPANIFIAMLHVERLQEVMMLAVDSRLPRSSINLLPLIKHNLISELLNLE